GGVFGDAIGRRIELDDRALPDAIARGVADPGLRWRIDARAGGAAVQRLVSPHLEEVREIGTVLEAQRVAQRPLAVVVERDPLVTGAVPQEYGTDDVLRFSLLHEVLAHPDVPVRQVYDERGVVIPQRRAEEDRPPAVDEQAPARQHARVAEVQAIGAPGSRHDIAAIVEQRETLAMFQRIGPGVGRGCYVIGTA